MRHVLTFVTMAAFWCSLVSLGLAEDKKASKSPDNKKVEAKADTSANAELRAKIHRTMAALIEAQSAEEPDQAKIDKLTKKLQQLRGKLQAQAPAAAGNQPAGWACPWGGPGMGFGRGAAWGGPGRGQGADAGPVSVPAPDAAGAVGRVAVEASDPGPVMGRRCRRTARLSMRTTTASATTTNCGTGCTNSGLLEFARPRATMVSCNGIA